MSIPGRLLRSPLPLGILCLGALLGTSPLAGADWPQWRGPDRDGRSPETGLLSTWPEGGPPLAWKATGMGSGYSSLAIVGDRVLTTGDRDGEQFVLAVSADGGSPLWATGIGPAHDDEYLGARSTPTVVGDTAWVLSTEGRLVAVELATGTVRWQRELTEDFGGELMKAMGQYDWKYSESPLVDGGRVIVTPGGPEAALAALDAETGETVWTARLPADVGPKGADGAGYSSAVVSEAAGTRQIVQLVGRGLVGVDAGDGTVLWTYNRVANDIANISTPLVAGDRIFASTAYETGAALVEIEKGETGLRAEEVYFLDHSTFQNHHGNMILDGGTVYAGHGHGRGFPMAIELETGDVRWGPIRNDGEGSAHVLYADGHVVFRYQNGLVVLVEASPDEYRETGSFTIPDVNQFSWSAPALSDGRLYLREQDRLLVYDVRGE